MQAFGNNQQQDLPTAYLGNLHKQTVQGDIDELFQGLKLEEVRIVHDRETGEPKGYGYAVFKDQQSLDEAVKLSGRDVCGQPIKIDVKRPSNRQRGGPYQGGGGGAAGGMGGGGFRGGRSSDFGPAFGGGRRGYGGGAPGGDAQGMGRPDRYNRPVPDQPPFTAYVGNLPEEAVESDLETMFQGLDLIKVYLVTDRETQHHKGYGYAEFNSRESLVKALTLDGAAWMNKTLKVNVHERKPRTFDNQPQGGGFNQGGGFAQGGGFGARPAGGDRFPRSDEHQAFGGDRRQSRQGGPGGYRPTEEPAPVDDGKERPKLVLKKVDPASKPSTPAQAPISSNKPNPFGNAKPVDTAAKLRQMEEEKKAADAKKAAAEKKDADAAAPAAAAPSDS